VIKRLAVPAVLFLTIVFLISGCVSSEENIAEQSSSQSATTVPGEKIPDEGNFTPGSPGASGTVRW
jgi:starvation-inducible outer membrane lipoprotein